ncbi:TBC domain-containing protein kinase-like protein [Ylistrum balloti]|uniref:TBC domain-containing protein kinase-like protein n=1 Tax=Ylistrum balloti TaxID=509963 RepID=UPI002905EC36|nr:TBC domain-containing protein kinase-like protein [Ylistrum balloti]
MYQQYTLCNTVIIYPNYTRMSMLGQAEFGVTTFFTRSHPNDKCGANGLPLTPNSVKVLGRFQNLKHLHHPRICKYLDIVKDKHERIVIVSEHYRNSLSSKSGTFTSKEKLTEVAYGVLQGLVYLNTLGITHRNLYKQLVYHYRGRVIVGHGRVKLAGYGLYYINSWFIITGSCEVGWGRVKLAGYGLYYINSWFIITGSCEVGRGRVKLAGYGLYYINSWFIITGSCEVGWGRVKLAGYGLYYINSWFIITGSCEVGWGHVKLAGYGLYYIENWFIITGSCEVGWGRVKLAGYGLYYINSWFIITGSCEVGWGRVKLAGYGLYYINSWFIITGSCEVGWGRVKLAGYGLSGRVKLAGYGLYYIENWFIITGSCEVGWGRVKLAGYGLYYINSWFIITGSCEVGWTQDLWTGLTMPQIFHKIFAFLKSDQSPLHSIAKDNSLTETIKTLSPDLVDFLTKCLTVSVNQRAQVERGENFDHLSLRDMEEVYYLWRLAGGDLEALLRKEGLVKTKPPITLLPSFCTSEGDVFGQRRDRAELLDSIVITASQDQLRNRLSEVDEKAYYPLLEDEQSCMTSSLPLSPSSSDLTNTASLPLIIKEKDVEYQFHRVILYERLLKAYPYKRAHIWKEARVDIPPLVRAHVWAALLEVEGDIEGLYNSIDKDTVTSTDRQIEVDIPRCHQYHELLSSPTAHVKFKRVLKAWVVSHPEYVYWQGLDSLCAPFLALNFTNEALAYACLTAFIPKYLHKIFLKDNSQVIQEYLAVFSHLIAFHDPELSNHLDGIGFIPDYIFMYFMTYAVSALISTYLSHTEIDIQRCVQDSIKIFCSTPKSATYRQHARPSKKVQKEESRPNLSYYSRDYNDQPSTDLSMEPIPIEDLKREKVPRISAEDLIELGELTGPAHSKSPTKRKQNSKPMLLVVDVRGEDEFNKGTVEKSINIPFHSAFSPEGDLNPCPAVITLTSSRSQVKVIVGSRGKNAVNFANEIVRLGFSKVCVLHKGIDVLRQTGLLMLPPADI